MADALRNEPEFERSPLDESTHAEMTTLYRESADTIRFAKSQQWRSLGATLLVFGALMILGAANTANQGFVKTLIGVSVLLSVGTIYSLVIYQIWQNTERLKLRSISENLSSLAREIRALKPQLEANLLRYLLLAFMVITVLVGNAVLIADLLKYLP